MADEIDTSIGDGAKNANVGKNNKQEITENSADNNVVINIPIPTWANKPAPRKPRQSVAKQGELMADAAQELWKTIGEMKETMGGFRQAVDINSQATKEQALSIKELSRVVEQSNQRNDAAALKMSEQIVALNRLANVIRGMGIQVPENGHVEPVAIIPSPPWWKEWIQPALLTILIGILIFYLSTGGHIP